MHHASVLFVFSQWLIQAVQEWRIIRRTYAYKYKYVPLFLSYHLDCH